MRTLRTATFCALIVLAAPTAGAAEGSFVNFESGHVRPLALSPSGKLLFAVNTPDNRLEIYRVNRGGLVRVGETVTGLEPVAVALRGEGEAYVVNHLSDSVSVVDASNPRRPFVKRTLLTGDEPRDVIIAGPDGDKVFVTAARRGQNRPGDPQLTTPGVGRADVWVWSALDLDAPPTVLTLFSDTPRALAVSPDRRTVYAAAFHSGNQTTVVNAAAVTSNVLFNAVLNDGFQGLGLPPPFVNIEGAEAPLTSLVVRWDGQRWLDSAGRDWSPRVRFNLSDQDVFMIDAASDPARESGFVTGVGTVLFNMAVNPADGRLYVSNLESRNDVRFEPELAGNIAQNRITIVDGAVPRPVHLNPHIDYSQPFGPRSEIEKSLAFPLGMEFSRDGTKLYAAAFGSGKVAALDAEAAVLKRIEVGGGPSGLALDERLNRLYVMNRFDHTISVVDLASDREMFAVPLRFNPEPAAVREGRRFLYDALESGHGDSSCASCHLFGDNDSLAWDLGDPNGLVERNPLQQVANQLDDGPPLGPFHPMKGPMTTQSLRGMSGAGAMHWRGDRNGGPGAPFDEGLAFMQFRPAFQTLLGKETELEIDKMEKFRDFILTVRYPPNPIANLDGTLTPEQAAGELIFDSDGSRGALGGDGDPCASCHTLPLGADGQASFEGLNQDFKVPHLRNAYTKIGMYGYALPGIVGQTGFIPRLEPTPTPHMGDQVRGYGFLHDGSIPTLFDFFRLFTQQFTFLDRPGSSGVSRVRQMEAFLLTFPTGLAPIVGQQTTLAAGNTESGSGRFQLLRARVDAGEGDLAIHGLWGDQPRAFLYLGGAAEGGRFQSDREGEIFTGDELLQAAASGFAVLTATVTPPGSGRRIAIDRDEDGTLDGDELTPGGPPRAGWRRR